MNQSVKIGVIVGIVISIFTVLIYKFGELSFQTSMINLAAMTALIIVSLVILGKQWIRPLHSPLSYGQALKYLFISAVIASTISTLISTVVFNNDTELYEAFKEMQINAQESMGDKFGFSEEQIEAGLEKLAKSDYQYPFKYSKLPMNIGIGLISGLIYALIAAIFVKEKKAKSSSEW